MPLTTKTSSFRLSSCRRRKGLCGAAAPIVNLFSIALTIVDPSPPPWRRLSWPHNQSGKRARASLVDCGAVVRRPPLISSPYALDTCPALFMPAAASHRGSVVPHGPIETHHNNRRMATIPLDSLAGQSLHTIGCRAARRKLFVIFLYKFVNICVE